VSSSTTQVPLSSQTVNKLAIVALALGGLAFVGIWVFGLGVLATFAVGAGHVSLNQIKLKHQKGRALALAGLAMGYGIATWALLSVLRYIPTSVQQWIN
jgi:hypothetical protein